MKKSFFLFSFLFLSFSSVQAAERGVLHVSVSPSFEHEIPRNAIRVPFLTLWAYAEEGDVTLSEIVIRRDGLSAFDDFESIWAENSLFQRSSRVRFGSDDLATITFPQGILIPQNTKEKIFIFANMQSEVGIGRTAFFRLERIKANGRPSDRPGHYKSYNTRQRHALGESFRGKNKRPGRGRRR